MMNEVTKYTTRKSMLYPTGVEYADYSMNHVQGCSHGCLFPCYAELLKRRFGTVKTHEEWTSCPVLVSNTLELLSKEIPRYKDKIESVHLCFATDPYMYGYPEIAAMSTAAITMLNNAGIRCNVLTKGILPFELSYLSPANEYGITVVALDEAFRERFEPGAAPIAVRIAALRALHDAGCYTYISMEPFVTPNIWNVNLTELLEAVGFVDKIIFGRLHYNKLVTAFPNYQEFYNAKVREVIQFCETRGIAYLIKEKTLA